MSQCLLFPLRQSTMEAPVLPPVAVKAPVATKATPTPPSAPTPRKRTKQLPTPGDHLRPFLKWAGGKAQQADRILDAMNLQPHESYHELFLGGGAVFFALVARDAAQGHVRQRVCLFDANPRLIATWKAIQADPQGMADALDALPQTNEPETYQRIRDEFNAGEGVPARFLWLNRAGFNGLYRENRRGHFNVPIGNCTYVTGLPDHARLHAVSAALRGAYITTIDFRAALDALGTGDVAYLDPPYVAEGTKEAGNAGFASYVQPFTDAHHVELDDLATKAARRGARVFVSASGGPRSLAIYTGGRIIYQTQVRRSVGSRSTRRGLASEALLAY